MTYITNMFYCNIDIMQQTNAELDKLKVCLFVNRLSLNIRLKKYICIFLEYKT